MAQTKEPDFEPAESGVRSGMTRTNRRENGRLERSTLLPNPAVPGVNRMYWVPEGAIVQTGEFYEELVRVTEGGVTSLVFQPLQAPTASANGGTNLALFSLEPVRRVDQGGRAVTALEPVVTEYISPSAGLSAAPTGRMPVVTTQPLAWSLTAVLVWSFGLLLLFGIIALMVANHLA